VEPPRVYRQVLSFLFTIMTVANCKRPLDGGNHNTRRPSLVSLTKSLCAPQETKDEANSRPSSSSMSIDRSCGVDVLVPCRHEDNVDNRGRRVDVVVEC
jgi:hypothetical protein